MAMLVKSMTAAVALAFIACGDPKYQPPAIVVTFSPYLPPPFAQHRLHDWHHSRRYERPQECRREFHLRPRRGLWLV